MDHYRLLLTTDIVISGSYNIFYPLVPRGYRSGWYLIGRKISPAGIRFLLPSVLQRLAIAGGYPSRGDHYLAYTSG